MFNKGAELGVILLILDCAIYIYYLPQTELLTAIQNKRRLIPIEFRLYI